MGTLSLEKIDHLLWLGRYIERCYTSLQFILTTYDATLDSTEGNWKGQLKELGFKQESNDPRVFFRECLFSREIPVSVFSSLSSAYDNAVVMRDVIGTESMAYVQMALNQLELAEESDAPLLDLQGIIDDIMAFKGSCDDYVSNDVARNTLKCGMSIERMDLYARLEYHLHDLRKELQKLASRIDRTGLEYNDEAFKELVARVFSTRFPAETTSDELNEILTLIANVF